MKNYTFPSDVPVLRDQEEWTWRGVGDEVLHIELTRWADVFLLAPLDANTMAKLAHGLCDDLLTCIARAWDFNKPILFAPAKNVHTTTEEIDKLLSWRYQMIEPIEKVL